MASQIKLRRGTAAQWTSSNPTLAEGEAGFEIDTNKLKIGDGSTAWSSLEYITSASSSVDLSSYLTISSASTTYATIASPDFSGNVFIDGTLLTSGSVNIQNTLLAGVVEAETGEFQGILTDTLTVGDVSTTEIGYLNNASANIQDQLNSKLDKTANIIKTNANSYTLQLSDAGKLIELNGGNENVIIVTKNDMPSGTQFNFIQTTSPVGTIVNGTDVVINATPGFNFRDQWSSITLIKRYTIEGPPETDYWVAIGDLVP